MVEGIVSISLSSRRLMLLKYNEKKKVYINDLI